MPSVERTEIKNNTNGAVVEIYVFGNGLKPKDRSSNQDLSCLSPEIYKQNCILAMITRST